MTLLRPDRASIARGAIYVFARKHRLTKQAVIDLLVERGSLKAETAKQLATHWFCSKQFQEGARQ